MTYYQYGGHQHPAGEVSLKMVEVIPVPSPRGDRFASRYRHHLKIELQHTEAENAVIFAESDVDVRKALRQSYINTKVNQLIDVYSVNHKSCGFFLDDGTQTRHYLSNATAAGNIGGVRVHYRSWDKDGGDEFVTVRSAYVITEGLYDEAESGLYAYREDIQIHGTGGADWELVENQSGPPIQQQIFPATKQVILQYGSIVGTATWITGNIPPPLHPSFEKGRRRVEGWESPKWFGNQYRLYGNTWSYRMELPTPQAAVPNLLYL